MPQFAPRLTLLALLLGCAVAQASAPPATGSQEPFTSVSAGDAHTLAVGAGGSLWAWGSNTSGQLGDGTRLSTTSPRVVSGISGVKLACAGGEDAFAIRTDGTVWAWGSNEYGQLGDGSTETRLMPVRLPSLTGACAISAGATHSAAVTSDGSVWTWGRNPYGQLGNGENGGKATVPGRVGGLPSAIAVSVGRTHTLALSRDGKIWAWGDNDYGQLGTGDRHASNVPKEVRSLDRVVSIAAGAYHSVALQEDGSVWTWGGNDTGQLGNGMSRNSMVPAKLASLSGVVSIAAGTQITLFGKGDGTVWACGYSRSGQLGRSGKDAATEPIRVDGVVGICSLSAGKGHAAAVGSDGSVWVWGSNSDSQLGTGASSNTWRPAMVLPFQRLPDPAPVSPAPEPVAVSPRVPIIELLKPLGLTSVSGSKCMYGDKVLFDAPAALDWAWMSPDGALVAYKAERSLGLYDVRSERSSLVYEMTVNEYFGQWVYSYGFLPGYQYTFVGWAPDSSFYVVDKEYPGLFKGGSGYYKSSGGAAGLSPIDRAGVVVK